MIANPDLLLLDEPTNHLDLDALEWLEEHLRRRHGSLLVASHDRAFLDATVERVWELRDRRLTPFRGNYSAYHRQREERDERAVREAGDARPTDIAKERDLVQKYRSQRKHTKMHEHEARLERLQADRREMPKADARAAAAGGRALGGAASRSGTIAAPDRGPRASGYATDGDARRGRRACRGSSRSVASASASSGRTAPARRRCCGRSRATCRPLDGIADASARACPLGYLAQLRGAAIPGTTVLDALLEAMPVVPGEARSYLARFLFRGDDVDKEVRTLSGGERSRLELALLGIMPSNLLLLDEPTNHLDIPAREAIEAFLRETPATVLVVSHDRRLLETICDRLWVVADGLAVPFAGGYREWRAAVADGWTVAAAAEAEAKRLRVGATGQAGRNERRPAVGDIDRGGVGRAPCRPRSGSAAVDGRSAAAPAASAAAGVGSGARRVSGLDPGTPEAAAGSRRTPIAARRTPSKRS